MSDPASAPMGSGFVVKPNPDHSWPARPTGRKDVVVFWQSGPESPDPQIVNEGTGGMMNNVDVRLVTAGEEAEHPLIKLIEDMLAHYKQSRGIT